MDEIWKTIEGFENYSVSNMGRVRRDTVSQHRNGHSVPGKIIKPLNYRYSAIWLSDSKGIQSIHRIHKLVAFAFLEPPPTPAYEINHKNSMKKDNRADNLEWVTHSENITHSHVNGTGLKGNRVGTAKLSETHVQEIKASYKPGYGAAAALGRKFGVTRTQICRIVHGQSWRHV